MNTSATTQVNKQAQQRCVSSLVGMLNALKAIRPTSISWLTVRTGAGIAIGNTNVIGNRFTSLVRSSELPSAHQGHLNYKQHYIRGLATLVASG